ncbi:MAG TPA: hypothetical protein VEV17_14745 [Bryobacteraceae bacterium]|nr:hypothetical protein [Bryobacteraceae bacterium]
MLYYPQLTTGSVCQFPVSREVKMRTVTNDLFGGDTIRMADTGCAAVRWQLRYKNLTDGEWSALEQLFEATEGRFGTFTFLDPTDNLLMWSEDWTQKVWNADPLLTVTVGRPDALGGTSAMQLTNNAQATQSIAQSVPVASWFQYCWSCFVRSDAPCRVQLMSMTPGEEQVQEIAVGAQWNRVAMPAHLSTKQDGMIFGIQLPAGFRIDVFGAQVEAQMAAGYYKKTVDRAGVHSSTRFDSDALTRTGDGPNQSACVVNLMSNLS